MALARTTKPSTHPLTNKIYVLTVIRRPLVLGLPYLFVRLPVAAPWAGPWAFIDFRKIVKNSMN